MSRFLTIVGDPHLTNKNQDKVRATLELAEAQGYPIVLMGDLLDTKEVIRGKSLNFWFDWISKSQTFYTIIVGNHDWFNLECEDHSLRVLSTLDNVLMVDSPKSQYDCWFIPYIHDQDQLKKVLKDIPKDATLFAHLEVKSFDFGNGYICEEGITTKALAKFKHVVSGHFHKFQQNKNLTYIGTPFSHSFGESNQDKFIGVINLDTNEIKYIPTNLPQHRTVEIELPTEDYGIKGKRHDYMRIILKGSQEEIDKFPKSTAEAMFDSVKWITKPTDKLSLKADLDESQSNEAQFKKWAEDLQGLDPETTKLGLQILGGCRG